jgi:hypothetical protein
MQTLNIIYASDVRAIRQRPLTMRFPHSAVTGIITARIYAAALPIPVHVARAGCCEQGTYEGRDEGTSRQGRHLGAAATPPALSSTAVCERANRVSSRRVLSSAPVRIVASGNGATATAGVWPAQE